MRRRSVVLSCLLVAGCGGASQARQQATTPPTTTTTAPAPAPSSPPRTAVEHLQALQRVADEHGGTRAAGAPGDAASRDYVAERLRAAGWTVKTEAFSFPAYDERSRPQVTGLRAPRDVRSLQYSASGTATGRVVRADGLGCTAADWRRVPRGAIALVDRGTCTFASKVRRAQARGVKALLVSSPTSLRGATIGEPGTATVPALIVTAAAARELEQRGGTVRVRVDAFSGRRRTANVVATKPGEGKTISAGAHLDSVPEGPGANDNASGVAALLHAAERLEGTKRPVELGFWGAEEVGLIGSRRHVQRLSAAERRAIEVHVNLDMVGTPKPRTRVSGGTDALRDAFEDALDDEGLATTTSDRGASNSDHASYRRAGIPAAFVHTGLDRCYHRACDTARAVDEDVLSDVAAATTTVLRDLASQS